MNLAEALSWATDRLNAQQIEDARLEAEILLAHALGLKTAVLISRSQNVLAPKELSLFKSLIERRVKHEPSAYIIGVQPFLSLDFFVNRSVLIPRPETELLVEKAIEIIRDAYSPNLSLVIADLGTGSGAITVSLVKNLPNARVIGLDSSPHAIAVAEKNARFHKVGERCQFLVGDLFQPLKEKVNLIISNPPYIPSAVIETLQPEVKDWEPREALDGGTEGLDQIRRLLQESPAHLKNNGQLIMEFGADQAEAIKTLSKSGFKESRILKDYSGKERILSART